MTDTDDRRDHLIRLLVPIHHVPPSAQSPSGEAAVTLLEGILRAEAPPARHRGPASWFARHRRLAVAVPTMAAVAVLAFGVSAALPTGSGPVGPAPAQALQITEDSGYIVIRIKDPVADPRRYREELARHHLDIDLSLAPAAPDRVGRVIFAEVGDTGDGPDLEWIEAPGDCTANGNCSAGIKVPVTFRSYARIVIGRTALPGEEIDGGSPEEDAQARTLVGKTVAEAKRILASSGRTASYRVGWESTEPPGGAVPDTWIVYDSAPLPGKAVALWVSADGEAPAPPRPGPEASGSWQVQPTTSRSGTP
ncbi:hypothetical protein Drose_12315 [Dactylosporangium roseum]|uniref:PASTA domain-containing protein n=1 Tax=Dactylosporangium roseum TaxID=47989 RepID=A0ABY5ZA47_9ACTN|nr:hypothetical protein [Dactylosporangium roseum]UWZ38934.1 hypothetical protein Drose_12315 [Dactylosporangium roseum]